MNGNDPHVYDGIVEHDNKLPLWWQLTLYGAVVFALVYWFGRRLDAIPSPEQEYASDMAAQRAAEAERARARGTIDDAVLTTLGRGSRHGRSRKSTLHDHVRAVPPSRRRRQHRSQLDRRVLD